MKFYIWSNEHRAWWKPGHCGYTLDKKEAGQYDQDEAMSICLNANERLSDDTEPFETMVPVLRG